LGGGGLRERSDQSIKGFYSGFGMGGGWVPECAKHGWNKSVLAFQERGDKGRRVFGTRKGGAWETHFCIHFSRGRKRG